MNVWLVVLSLEFSILGDRKSKLLETSRYYYFRFNNDSVVGIISSRVCICSTVAALMQRFHLGDSFAM